MEAQVMKRIIPMLIIGVVLLSGFGAGALQTSQETTTIDDTNNKPSYRGTHTALGEYGTATWCGYCKYAHGALKELYAEGQLDFNYVSLVCDKNSVASSYATSHFNLYGYPTVWWDGGYKVNVGAGSIPSAKTAYTTSINQCVARVVYDVDITLDVTWIGGTEMQIDCSILNNEDTTYDGTIRVYITEKESSMNWRDTAGALYTHAFLDFAFNEAISIPAGDTWTDSMNWVGSSHGYSSVTEANTMIIAAVENDEVHQGYSYPPTGNPFNAYYVDDCVTADLGDVLSCDAGGPYTGEVDDDIQFTGTATGGIEPYTWAWDFGDGATANAQNPTHAYTAAGYYTATLTVTDAEQTVVSDTATVTITESSNEPIIIVSSISGGFGVKAVIKNIGTGDATGVAWEIALDGNMVFVGKSKTGTIDIPAGGSVTVKSFVIGFGATNINVTAADAAKTATGKVLLFFVTGVV